MSLADITAPYSGLTNRTTSNAILEEVRAARRFKTVAILLANTTMAYGTGTRPVAAGDRLKTVDGHVYEVAASGASDHHHAVGVSGAVKLYEDGLQFTTLARFQAKIARGDTYRTGDTVHAAGIAYVKDGGTGLSGLSGWSLADAAPAPINAQTGTAYTAVLSDAAKRVTMANASANVFTIPANASVAFPVGTEIAVIQKGAGATTITGAAGVTVNGVSAGSVAIPAQWRGAVLFKVATNEWIVS